MHRSYASLLSWAEEEYDRKHDKSVPQIILGLGTCGLAAGGREVLAAVQQKIAEDHIQAEIVQGGCIGSCYAEPLMDIVKPGGPRVSYRDITPQKAVQLIEDSLVGDEMHSEWALAVIGDTSADGIPSYKELPFFKFQERRVSRNCGFIDPAAVEEFILRDGYRALAKALLEMSPQQVLDEVKASGLRGRGGAGFPTGLKWQFCRQAKGDTKYLICNFDEGDPGAFMNRSLVEGDPHSLLEGMLIAAYALGAAHGYIYVRAEYPLAIVRLKAAIQQARDLGLLGENILDTGFNFDITIKEGAGAFVCGEETALMASIEGRRGMPRPRPPFPAQSGLWGKPTNINNVGTLANVPRVILNGAEWYKTVGTETTPGTKIFCLTGKIANSGWIEVPMGTTLSRIIYDIGGGTVSGRPFKAAQTGGPSGGCLSSEYLDLPIDYESLTRAGTIMGSGGMVVMDEDTCMVDIARFFISFTQKESCGKCVPCRLGTKRMLEILEKIVAGKGELSDIDLLMELGQTVQLGSLCGLGQTAPNPVLSTIRYFRDEYEAHIVDKHCPAGVCKALVHAPCTNACPAGVDVPSYVSLISQGKYAEALAMHRKRNPFPLVCSRVCPAFCETHCRRGELDQPVAIRQLKRFMADHERDHSWTPEITEAPKKERIAIVGSGPAGLTAALRLAQWGYQATVYEALPVAGGMMAAGIPKYRLPRQLLTEEIEAIKRAKVEIVLNSALGRNFTVDSLFDQDGYDAVILAIGAHKSRRLGIPGEDLKGVYQGTEFLRKVNLGEEELDLAGKQVAVIGGGNTAIDAARTAFRLGAAEVHVVYRRTRADMPASDLEIEEAAAEGVQFRFLTNPSRIIGNGQVEGMECLVQEMGEFDRSGRRRPVPLEGSEFVMPADVVIPAIGQAVDLSWKQDENIETNRNTTLVVNKQLSTTRAGVFAAGDAVLGPATVVEAVAQGNKVAMSVDAYLRDGHPEPKDDWLRYDVVELTYNMEDYAYATRAVMPVQEPEVRRTNWDEIELGFTESVAQEECKRCLRCDIEEE